MKYFITKRKIKLPRYQFLIVIVLIIIGFVFMLHKMTYKGINETFTNILVSNSFGGVSKKYNYSPSSIFYKNIYGFNIEPSKKVMGENASLKDFIVHDDPIIYLYNTFQTDKYKNNYYSTYNINPVITQANLILQEYLKKEGVNSIVEKESVAKVLKENNIPYTNSYKGSRILLESAFKQNSSIKYFFDIQLSDSDYNATTTKIGDFSYAKILFVVGCSNPNYEENRELAISLNKKLEAYANLSRGVSLRCGDGYQGWYNEDFNKNTLLIEIGGKSNTIDEVNRTMKIFAKILKEEIKN